MKSKLQINLCLLLIAFIWGVGFVPQRLGMETLGPSAFNALRFIIGAITLMPILLLFKSVTWQNIKQGIPISLVLGTLLFLAAVLQQSSIQYTSIANVAFITGMQMIFVPIIGYFIGYRYTTILWLGGTTALLGLYLMTGSSTEISIKGDLLALLGALFFAIHLLVLAKKAAHHNQLALAFIQFLVCGSLSALVALGYEDRLIPNNFDGLFWPMVNGVFVVGIAYTLQVVVMEVAEPFNAGLIFSLEAVFGALAGYWVFTEVLNIAGIIGAILMLTGCLLAQLPSAQRPRVLS